MTAADDRRAAPACARSFVDPERVARVRKHLPGDRVVRRLGDTFHVLADPTRLRILHALAAEELCVCDLAPVVGLTASAVSHQLARLRRASLVRCRRDGKRMYYALDDAHIEELLRTAREHVEHD